MNDRFFIDTNVLIYAFSNDTEIKKQKARELLNSPFFVSVQVIFEFINVSIKKLGYSKMEAIENAKGIMLISEIIFENGQILNKSLELLNTQSFSIFDSKIVACAIISNCGILYSEDLQNGQLIENKLRIINPFIKK